MTKIEQMAEWLRTEQQGHAFDWGGYPGVVEILPSGHIVIASSDENTKPSLDWHSPEKAEAWHDAVLEYLKNLGDEGHDNLYDAMRETEPDMD